MYVNVGGVASMVFDENDKNDPVNPRQHFMPLFRTINLKSTFIWYKQLNNCLTGVNPIGFF